MLDQLYKIAGIIVAAAILVGGVFWLARLDADVRYLQKDMAELRADVDDMQRNQVLILDILRRLADDDPQPQPQPTDLDDWGGWY